MFGRFFAPWVQPNNERMNGVDAFWLDPRVCAIHSYTQTHFGPLNWNFMWLLSNSFSQNIFNDKCSALALLFITSNVNNLTWNNGMHSPNHWISCSIRFYVSKCAHEYVQTNKQWRSSTMAWSLILMKWKREKGRKKYKTTEAYRYKTNNQLTSKTEKLM